jgi:hypothetical protein
MQTPPRSAPHRERRRCPAVPSFSQLDAPDARDGLRPQACPGTWLRAVAGAVVGSATLQERGLERQDVESAHVALLRALEQCVERRELAVVGALNDARADGIGETSRELRAALRAGTSSTRIAVGLGLADDREITAGLAVRRRRCVSGRRFRHLGIACGACRGLDGAIASSAGAEPHEQPDAGTMPAHPEFGGNPCTPSRHVENDNTSAKASPACDAAPS